MSEVLLKQLKEKKAYELLAKEFKAMRSELKRREQVKQCQCISVLVAISNKLDTILAE